ncbi:MAG: hypothetical protein Q7R74_00905 [bacterium]|nr:hypothetical protein [bacterium]
MREFVPNGASVVALHKKTGHGKTTDVFGCGFEINMKTLGYFRNREFRFLI